ncbi:MAG: hypothetical protein FWF33_03105 [Clostridiales bacterium]|nr:hypothetical protein [Clostridiales bacterium]
MKKRTASYRDTVKNTDWVSPAAYRKLVIGTAQYCRDMAVETGRVPNDYKNLITDASLLYKDLLLEQIREMPIEYRNGELVVFSDKPDAWENTVSKMGGKLIPADGADTAENEGKKSVYVLLTKQHSVTSILVRLFTLNEYTHSSIALERDGSFYSFNPGRGFTVERPIGKKRSGTPCRLYRLEVSDQTFQEIESRIHWFLDNPQQYKFNYVGMVFTILRIPVGFENRYFCSQFVSEMLSTTGAASLRTRPNYYLPRHFLRESGLKLSYAGEASGFEGAPAEPTSVGELDDEVVSRATKSPHIPSANPMRTSKADRADRKPAKN